MNIGKYSNFNDMVDMDGQRQSIALF